VRKSIWLLQIPELQDNDAAILAKQFDFTGGQIENIARKYIIDSVLAGERVSLETLILHCQSENLGKNGKPAIGFRV
jgi:hypothetical protein